MGTPTAHFDKSGSEGHAVLICCRGSQTMTKASDIMTTDVVTVRPETKITEAAGLMLSKRINGLPVINDDQAVIGILCQSDLIVQQRKFPLPTVFTLLDGIIPLTSTSHLEKEVQKMSATTVDQAMTRDPVCIGPDTDLEELAEVMLKKKYHTLPVVKDGKLVGVIGKEDILRTLAQ
jgi:CBS domain-containing protein